MKINQLLHKIPYGAVVTTAWLASHGVTSDQARKLASSGWLQRVGHGAYCKAGEPLTWESAVFALQASDDTGLPPLWPGGQTALALHGFAHYLSMGRAHRICMARKPYGCPDGRQDLRRAGSSAPRDLFDVKLLLNQDGLDRSVFYLKPRLFSGGITEVQQMEKKNLVLEALRKLLNDDIRSRTRTNVVESRAFTERLEDAIARYHANAITTAEVLQELIQLAKDLRSARERGEANGMTLEEIAFYDALSENDSAMEVMGDEQLRVIAQELLMSLRDNVTVDWAVAVSLMLRIGHQLSSNA